MLEEAVSEYDAHRYEEARALFRRAHDISPNARTLRGIGMADFELREYVEALRSLEAALVDKRRALTPSQRQQVETLVERTRAFVGRFFLKLSPKEIVLHVDGAPAAIETDGSLLLSFGRHTLAAEAAGAASENREINVIGGERQELSFQLHPDAAALAAKNPGAGAAGGAGNQSPGSGADTASSGPARWFTGAGVVAAGAVGSFLWWRHQNDGLNQCDASNLNTAVTALKCDNRSALSSRKQLAIGSTIGLGVAALGLGIIGTVVWSTNSKPDSGTALACVPLPGAVNCDLQIRF
jgi:tetratricopeptide (TPR) repeat protein